MIVHNPMPLQEIFLCMDEMTVSIQTLHDYDNNPVEMFYMYKGLLQVHMDRLQRIINPADKMIDDLKQEVYDLQTANNLLRKQEFQNAVKI